MELLYQNFTQDVICELMCSLYPNKLEHFPIHKCDVNNIFKQGVSQIQRQGDLQVALKPLKNSLIKLHDDDNPLTDTTIKEHVEKYVRGVARAELCGSSTMKLFLDRKAMLSSLLPSFPGASWQSNRLSGYVIGIEVPDIKPGHRLTNYRCHLVASHLRRMLEMNGAAVHSKVIDENKPQIEWISSSVTQERETKEDLSYLRGTSGGEHCLLGCPTAAPLLKAAPHCFQFRVSSKFHLGESELLPTVLCSSVINKAQGTKVVLSQEDFIGQLKKELTAASYHKYDIVGSVAWEDYLSNLAERCLTLQLMGVHHLSPVKVSVGENTDNARATAFVLYNHARLCALFRNFNFLVEEKVIPSVPEVEKVDFSLLNQEEEWTLFWVYVLRYPVILHDLVQAILSTKDTMMKKSPPSLPTHTLARFLHELAHCLSGYYNRVHILPCGTKSTPPPHLLPTLWARIYLLKTVHSVMKSCFDLLGVVPPTVM